MLITGDLGFAVLTDYWQRFPKQFLNAGVAEQNMTGMAAGMALEGMITFTYSIANFTTLRCLEQIRNDVCYMKNPVTVVAVGAGLGYGVHGYTHHAVEDITIMRALPNMEIYSPADAIETNYCVDLILANESPAYLRLGKGGEPLINLGALGSLPRNVVVEEGTDGVICWTGGIGAKAVAASSLLKEVGIKPMLVSVPVISDKTITELLTLANGKKILSIEEHILPGGFGSWILEVASNTGYRSEIARIGVTRESNTQIGSQNFLLEYSGLSPEGISLKFKKLLNGSIRTTPLSV